MPLPEKKNHQRFKSIRTPPPRQVAGQWSRKRERVASLRPVLLTHRSLLASVPQHGPSYEYSSAWASAARRLIFHVNPPKCIACMGNLPPLHHLGANKRRSRQAFIVHARHFLHPEMQDNVPRNVRKREKKETITYTCCAGRHKRDRQRHSPCAQHVRTLDYDATTTCSQQSRLGRWTRNQGSCIWGVVSVPVHNRPS